MSEGRQNSCSDNRLTGNQTETGADLIKRQCRCRCRIKSVIVQLLLVGAQLPTLYNTVEYLKAIAPYRAALYRFCTEPHRAARLCTKSVHSHFISIDVHQMAPCVSAKLYLRNMLMSIKSNN